MNVNERNCGMITIKIWGSCVSREIFNHQDAFLVNGYVFQNSMLYIDADPFYVSDDYIVATSSFSRRMVKLELTKKAWEEFAKVHSEWIMLDLADFRQSFFEYNDNKDCVLSGSGNVRATLVNYLGSEMEFNRYFHEYRVDELDESLVKMRLLKFCELLKKQVKEDRIIINETGFCHNYLKDYQIIKLNHWEDTVRNHNMVKMMESMLKSLLPRARWLSMPEGFCGDYSHHLGFNTLHYMDFVYQYKLENLKRIVCNGQENM